MEKQELRIEHAAVVDDIIIIPIAKISLQKVSNHHSAYLYASKEPANVVIIAPGKRIAFNLTGERIPLEDLFKELPGLADVIEKYGT